MSAGDDMAGVTLTASAAGSLDAPLTPGAYLALRRTAAGLLIDDVAAAVTAVPHYAELDRKHWLQSIETGLAPVGEDIVAALEPVFAFDPEVVILLDAIARGAHWAGPDVCRACGCSDHDPCYDAALMPCGWSETDRKICTACAERQLVESDQGETA